MCASLPTIDQSSSLPPHCSTAVVQNSFHQPIPGQEAILLYVNWCRKINCQSYARKCEVTYNLFSPTFFYRPFFRPPLFFFISETCLQLFEFIQKRKWRKRTNHFSSIKNIWETKTINLTFSSSSRNNIISAHSRGVGPCK